MVPKIIHTPPPPTEGIFPLIHPPPLWKFQSSFIHLPNIFALSEFPILLQRENYAWHNHFVTQPWLYLTEQWKLNIEARPRKGYICPYRLNSKSGCFTFWGEGHVPCWYSTHLHIVLPHLIESYSVQVCQGSFNADVLLDGIIPWQGLNIYTCPNKTIY